MIDSSDQVRDLGTWLFGALCRRFLVPFLDPQSTEKNGLQAPNAGYAGHHFGYFGGPGGG